MPPSDTADAEQELLAFLATHFDVAYYLEAYGDVAQSGLDPLSHWLTRGIADGRQISPAIDLRHGTIVRRSTGRIWRHFRWRGHDIAVRVTQPIASEVAAQVAHQARHDPTILAARVPRSAHLHWQDRENLPIDVSGLRLAIPHPVDVLLIVPDLNTDGAGSFTSALLMALHDAGCRPVQTIVADQEAPEALEMTEILEPFRTTNVVFWRNFWTHGPETGKLALLAQLTSLLQPRVTIVAGSRHGYEMVARFGRGLSRYTKFYCTFAGAGAGQGFAASLPRRILPFATALTDDIAVAERLQAQYSDLLGHGVILLSRDGGPAAFTDTVVALFARA